MRCLYCGKELALLKRLRGGSEFCSDAHRQQYQEEYNQLALNRLLQAKPEPKPEPKTEPEPVPVAETASASAPRFAAVLDAPEAPPAPRNGSTPVARAMPPATPAEPPKPAPAELREPPQLGFLKDSLTPAEPPAHRVRVELAHLASLPPVLPEPGLLLHEPEAAPPDPSLAGRLPIPPGVPRNAPLRLEPRGFDLKDTSQPSRPSAGLLGKADRDLPQAGRSLSVPLRPSSSAPPASLWSNSYRSFDGPEAAAGPLTQMMFRTVGFVEGPDQLPAPVEEPEAELFVPLAELSGLPAPPFPAAPGAALTVSPTPLATEPVEPELAEPLPAEPPTSIPEPERPPAPLMASLPLRVEMNPALAGRGRPVQVYASLTPTLDLQVPSTGAVPLRPLMILVPGAATGPTPVAETPPLTTESKRQRPLPEIRKPEKFSAGQPEKIPAHKPTRPLPEKTRMTPKGAVEMAPKAAPPAAVAALPEEPVKTPPAVLKQIPIPAKPDVSPVSVEPPAATPAVTPGQPADLPKIEEPKITPEQKPESSPVEARPMPPSVPPTSLDFDVPSLRLEPEGFWGRLPLPAKLAMGVVILAAVSGLAYLVVGGTASAVPSGSKRGAATDGPLITDGVWVEDWSADAAKRGRHINLFKTALPLSDYRVRFEAQIESKAIGWVFRAADPGNYYVAKLEIVQPGPEPTIALSRFAVIQGQDGEKESTPIRRKVRLDTMYQVRFEAVGDRFTAWLGDEKVAEWSDARLKAGPPGLMNEKGESASVRGNMKVTALVVKR